LLYSKPYLIQPGVFLKITPDPKIKYIISTKKCYFKEKTRLIAAEHMPAYI